MSDPDHDPPARAAVAGRPPQAVAAPKRRARRRRDPAVADPANPRLTDATRAALSRMAGVLAGEFATALIERLGEGRTPRIVARLSAAGFLRDPELLALLLRRDAEHGLVRRRDPYAPPLLPTLAHDSDVAVSTAARALIVAEARRHDRFDDPLLPAADLPAELHHRLMWATAAAMRAELGGAAGGHDRAIAAAANAALARYDEAMTFDSRATALVRALDSVARLDDALLAACAWRGPPALFAAALATRAEIAADGAWEMLLDPAGDPLARLLRAADVAPATSERILVAAHPQADAALIVTDAQSVAPADAAESLHLWRIDPAYRAAILALERG